MNIVPYGLDFNPLYVSYQFDAQYESDHHQEKKSKLKPPTFYAYILIKHQPNLCPKTHEQLLQIQKPFFSLVDISQPSSKSFKQQFLPYYFNNQLSIESSMKQNKKQKCTSESLPYCDSPILNSVMMEFMQNQSSVSEEYEEQIFQKEAEQRKTDDLFDQMPVSVLQIQNVNPIQSSSYNQSLEQMFNLEGKQGQLLQYSLFHLNPYAPFKYPLEISPLPVEFLDTDKEQNAYEAHLLKKAPILKQNNNFPKLLMNRFFQYVKDQPNLSPLQKIQLQDIEEELKLKKFQKTTLRHFEKIFQSSHYHFQNRNLLHEFLCSREFVFDALLKSKAMKNKNKHRYLLGAKLAKIRSYSSTLAVRIQTNKDSSTKSS